MSKESEKKVEPSRKTDGKYAILMETSEEECESWYYFIRIENNEENLKHLQNQLDKIDWYMMENLSVFELEMDFNVSALTAKEMTKIDLNATSFHRKFDGKLKKIDFEFSKKDGNETKIYKVYDTIGFGKIEEFIDDEDIDEEDMVNASENESITESESSESEVEDNRKKIPSSVLRNSRSLKLD